MRRLITTVFILGMALPAVHAADMNVQLTTSDGSTKFAIQNASAVEVSSVNSLGDSYFRNVSAKSFQINNVSVISSSGHFAGGGATPAIAATATLGSITPTITGTDTAGRITLTPGVVSVGGIVATVTFNTPYATAPYVTITPANSLTASLTTLLSPLVFSVNSTTAGFVMTSTGAGLLGSLTAYQWNYIAIQ